MNERNKIRQTERERKKENYKNQQTHTNRGNFQYLKKKKKTFTGKTIKREKIKGKQ